MSDGNLARDLRGTSFEPSRAEPARPASEAGRSDSPVQQPATSRSGDQAGGQRFASTQGGTPAGTGTPGPASSGRTAGIGGGMAPAAPATHGPARPPRSEDSGRSAPDRGRAETDRGGGGWVSNLLRRASEDEDPFGNDFAPSSDVQHPSPASPTAGRTQATPERSPDHVVESLNSLSMDIARAIDHNASIELWDRYRRGERNVFTRRLYTMQGQQTFDDIRRKYQRDPEFRDAVDRYIADFEALLQDIARNDPENRVSRTYLASDTGKVYTMLAHASGRFDS
ncbi:hypothetical protein OH818_25390 [Jiella pelagia]|uniref:Uncharacterized protein n=1 Tax=Jiella pelagia TaxID=2986949 RepID=A0ABY7BYN7_9HYPH|nr:hypothetical protein [Jiella pelagia]WAP68577.1 hypothetical protein OH818_25390 [Jiella pelagia]